MIQKIRFLEEEIRRFCEEMGVPYVPPFGEIVTNGEKQPKSILNKAQREADSKNPRFTLRDFNDLCRATLITSSYPEIIKLLNAVKTMIPRSSGKITRTESGYIGVHLNFDIDHIPTEIQLATPEVYLVKQATEPIYQRHRRFIMQKSFAVSKLINLPKEEETIKMKKQFIREYELFEEQYAKKRALFQKVYELSHLDESLPDLEAMLMYYKITSPGRDARILEYDELLELPLVQQGIILDDNLILEIAGEINPVTKRIQNSLVRDLEKAHKYYREHNEPYELTSIEVFALEFREHIKEEVYDKLVNKYSDKDIKELSYIIENEITKAVVGSMKWAIEQGYDLNQIQFEEFYKKSKEILIEEGKMFETNDLIETIQKKMDREIETNKIISKLEGEV